MGANHHGLGPELGSDPVTYTCWCGFRGDYNTVGDHITDERERSHTPRRDTTIENLDGAKLEIGSTPYGDEHDAVEVRMHVRESEGRYWQRLVLVRRLDIPFLIEELEAHRLNKDADPCDACAAQAFAARLTDSAMQREHTCAKPR